ncbi:hypothetical protein [Streptomyces sp. NPDC090026]|uniref:hypothetical protein n=1 Tax=Streptomyces sp. NPDC090026 TaxID=3365923 RepID=UPI003822CC9D
MTVAVVVPWRPDSPHRQATWAWVRARWAAVHPDWQVVTGACPEGPWSKGAAVADALRQTDADLVVVADADVWCDGVQAAVDAVRAGPARWAIPHTLVRRLTTEATVAVLAGGPLGGPTAEIHRGVAGGGLVTMGRDLAERVPMDPLFTGWGQEDEAWALALDTLVGPPWRGREDLWHLWHPPAPRQSRAVGSAESMARYRRYQTASGQQAQMTRLLAEFCPNPLEGSRTVSYTYRNENTGQVVSQPRPHPRLEMLPNWHRIAEPAPPPEPAPDLQEPEAPPPVPDQAATPGEPLPPLPDSAYPADSQPLLPPQSAPKADWQAYAASLAQDSDEAALVATLTKAELINRYGAKE